MKDAAPPTPRVVELREKTQMVRRVTPHAAMRLILTDSGFDVSANKVRRLVREMSPRQSGCKVLLIMDAKPIERGWEDDLYRWYEYLLVGWNVAHAEMHAVFIKPLEVVQHQWWPFPHLIRVKQSRMLSLVKAADVVYALGGNPYMLMAHLEGNPKVRSALVKRVVNGECLYMSRSAGSMILGDYVASKETQVSRTPRGLGLLPGFVIRPHVDSKEQNVDHGAQWRRRAPKKDWSLMDLARDVVKSARRAVTILMLSKRVCATVFKGDLKLVQL